MSDTPDQPQKYARGCGFVFLAIMLAVSAAWGAALGGFVYILEDAQTAITALEEFRPKIGSRVYDANGELIGEFTRESRQLVRLSEIPLHLQKAFMATEDHVFYNHKGVRPDAIVNAAIYISQTGRIRGGSTITQQVVRNIDVTGVSKEVSLNRKLKEAIIALQLERQYTKDEILELYLNILFLGISAHGVEAASQQYFAKSCRDVTLSEGAMLAGLARSPNAQEPFRNFGNALARRDIVLDQMLDEGFITSDERDAAKAEDLSESVVTPEERARLIEDGRGILPPNQGRAPYFFEEVRKFLLDDVPEITEDDLYGDGLEIYTTLDMKQQRAAERALLKRLETFDESKRETLVKQGKEADFTPVTGAFVCLDNRPPYQGYVRAMVGGRDFKQNQYNTVTQAYRQPGSSVKPFVWAAAIDSEKWTAADIVVDEPFTFVDAAGTPWSPKNFDSTFSGPVTLRNALEKSINIVSVKLVRDLGFPFVKSYIERSGISKPIDPSAKLTIALGVHSATPMEQAVAFSIFPNGGDMYKPTIVTEIKDRDGFVRYKADRAAVYTKGVIRPESAYVMTHLLEGAATYGTGARTAPLERPRAGKTGTTNDAVDVWFCGFTPQFTGVVWIGYRENNRSLGRGTNYTGGRLAAPIWTEFMIEAHKGLPIMDFEAPENVEFIAINKASGTRGGNFQEAFIKGTAPREYVPPVVAPDPTGIETELQMELLDAL